MKKFILIVLAALFAALPARGQLSQLSFSSYKIESFSLESLRCVSGAVSVRVANSADGFTMSGIDGVIYKSGKPFMQGTCGSVRVPSGTNSVSAKGKVSLCQGVSFWDVVSSVFSFNPDDYTADVKMTISMDGGSSRAVSKEKLPVGAMLRNKFFKK